MVKVDQNKCIGCGLCTSICPEVFELGKNGKSTVKNPKSKAKCIKEAIASCPVQAISE
jgi:ferredoxin